MNVSVLLTMALAPSADAVAGGGDRRKQTEQLGRALGWCCHEHTRVVGDSADPHQHERSLLPEDLQDSVCKERALLDRSREAHEQYLLYIAVVRRERSVDSLKQGSVAKR